MTITISRPESGFDTCASDMETGCAYEDSNGIIYICVRLKEILAVSVCAGYVLYMQCASIYKVREVNLEVKVIL